MKVTKEECYNKLKDYYDGYHFCQNSKGVYNLFSLLSALKRQEFGSYWFATGTPIAFDRNIKKEKLSLAESYS